MFFSVPSLSQNFVPDVFLNPYFFWILGKQYGVYMVIYLTSLVGSILLYLCFFQ